jgi:hypothetical protein|tara:strand:- start:1424 stop:3067 length:1644 start_codon:yes stop_codon:yes gene_type:complete
MKKIAIYMAIFGGYDFLYEPKYVSDNCDYIVFTDSDLGKSDVWDIRQVTPLYKQPVRMARKYKALPHRFLPEYEYSIWVDGNYQICGDPTPFIETYLNDYDMACWDHQQCKLDPRNCIYKEAEAIYWFGDRNYNNLTEEEKQNPERSIKTYKDNPVLIQRQVEKYKKEKFPENNGLIVAGKIYRRHNAPEVVKVGEDWWTEMKYYSHLDQMGFDYVAWKNNFKFNWVQGDIRDDDVIKLMGKHKSKIGGEGSVPINLQYFLNMRLQRGGGGKEVILNNKVLDTVGEAVEFWKDKDLDEFRKQLSPDNWQYFNCMDGEFKHGVGDHHELGWSNLTKEYYDSKENMTDEEIEEYLKSDTVEFQDGFIKHSYHRAVAMIGRLIRNKSYIPFYMNKSELSSLVVDVNNIERVEKLGIEKEEFTICQSGILPLMGVRKNDDIDIIISESARNRVFGGNKDFIRTNGVEIFEENKSKFILFDAQGDDDLIKNYSLTIDGYNFLEPRFYFSRKNKKTERDMADWKGIKNFFEMESYKGYPFHEYSLNQLGYDYI